MYKSYYNYHTGLMPGYLGFNSQERNVSYDALVGSQIYIFIYLLIYLFHRYQYPPMHPLWYQALGLTMICLGTMSMVGNGIVVYIFLCTKNLRTPSNILVVNLAFSDFCMMFSMAPTMVLNCFYETWTLGPFMCELYGMLGSLFGCTSIWSMVMIAFDRYTVIVKAYLELESKRLLSTCPDISGSTPRRGMFPAMQYKRYVPEGNLTACGTDYLTKDWHHRSYLIFYGFFVYFVPLILIIYAYYFIVRAVSVHEKQMREQAKKMNVATLRSGDQSGTSAEIKLAKVALMTISLWFLAWTPYLVINFGGILEMVEINPLITIWGSVFAKANAVYNPIVYAISHPKFRQALDKKFPSLVCGTVESDSSSAASVQTNVTDDKA
ncbi:rhodopsin-like [Diaphorina citri]|uniref:Rhodopsin-like n=1 Tax=Diaphorina citri TaxID=121845 RepID=A0A1S3DEH0_DIACI|nr:rhodopsin-like [Diaphorina citri]